MSAELVRSVITPSPTKAPQHEQLRVSEVDHEQDAVDERVAQGDQRVHAAQGHAVDELRDDEVYHSWRSCLSGMPPYQQAAGHTIRAGTMTDARPDRVLFLGRRNSSRSLRGDSRASSRLGDPRAALNDVQGDGLVGRVALVVERDLAGDTGGLGVSDVLDDRVATSGGRAAPALLALASARMASMITLVASYEYASYAAMVSPGNFFSNAALKSWPLGSLSSGRPTDVAKSPSACSRTGELDELGVVETVAAHQRSLDAAVLGLLGQERAGVVDAAVVDDVGIRWP